MFIAGPLIYLFFFVCFIFCILFGRYIGKRKKSVLWDVKRIKRYGIFGAILLLATAGIVLPLFVAQTQFGMCLEAGRALSEDELRQAVLRNLVNYRVEDTIRFSREADVDYERVGLASPTSETNIKELVEKSFKNEKSIEENFGLEPLVSAKPRGGVKQHKFDLNQLKEPFMLVSYGTNRGDRVAIYLSPDVREVNIAEIELITKSKKEKESFFERLLGYGNHYFNIPFTGIKRECCDNRRYSEMTQEEYLALKRKAYQETLSWLERFPVTTRSSLVPVSNCGNIPLTSEHDSGVSHRMMQWVHFIRGE